MLKKITAEEILNGMKDSTPYGCIICGKQTALKGIYINDDEEGRWGVVFSVCKIHQRSKDAIADELKRQYN